ncbi:MULTISPECIES: hypothetical protein [unclassified Mycoplasma]|uniref:hypothetical protein n=1 Tax=unclassified Mycoplasma TaxID=2683645 RepID=UPI000FDF53A2
MKRLFYRLETSDLIRQITISALLITLGVVIERFLHFHVSVGVYPICLGGLLMALAIPLLVDWRVSLVSSLALITLTELLISGDANFWLNYLPMITAIVVIEIFKSFKHLGWAALGLTIALAAFVILKAFLTQLVYGSSMALAMLVSTGIQMAILGPVALLIYVSLYRVMISMNRTFYKLT